MQITRKLQRWGNSTAIRLPKQAMEQVDLKDGQTMAVSVQGNSVLLTPVDDLKDMTLSTMLRDADLDNVNEGWDWGQDVGQEILP